MRILATAAQDMDVYRVTYGGKVVWSADSAVANPTETVLRVDVEIDGKFLTVWVRER